MKNAIFAALAAVSLSCASAKPADCPAPVETPPPAAQQAPAALFPAFILDALAGPHALRAKLYVEPDGTVSKYAVYVSREAIPDWVHTLADEQIGAGEEGNYEVEVYADGAEVYEVTRTIEGRKREMSVTKDKSLRYTERGLAADEVPEAVRAAVATVEGFEVKEWEEKKLPEGVEYHVKGAIGEIEWRLVVSGDSVAVKRRRVPTAIELVVP